MGKVISKISQSHYLRTWFRNLRLHRLYNAWLERWPRERMTRNGIFYRAKRTESVATALEILEGGEMYMLDCLRDPGHRPVRFVDLGCNVGFFVVALADRFDGQIEGIAVDANPAMTPEMNWHIRENNLHGVLFWCAIVGSDTETFHVNRESNTISNSVGLTEDAPLWFRKQFGSIRVEKADMARLWLGGQCDILKLDIEGAEAEFLEKEGAFMQCVQQCLIEWHTPWLTKGRMLSLMADHGLCQYKIGSESPAGGIAVFWR